MTRYLIFIFIFLVGFSCNEEKSPQDVARHTEKISYDSTLAHRLGADEYGMQKYVLALLKKGPKRSQSPQETERIQAAHLKNIMRLAKEKKLVFAGPVLDDSDLQGIFIFNVREIKEAKMLIQSDPAIQSGRLIMELYPWYGTAALEELNAISKKIAKTRI